MNTIRFEENVKLIKTFMDRLWAMLPAGWCPEVKEDRKDDSIELCLRNHSDCTYAKHYLVNVSYRSPEEILFHAVKWAIGYIIDTYANERTLRIRNCIHKRPEITKVIFNDPATIVFWLDGTKTVVKCDDKEIYDPEKGLAMAISKKSLGNQGNYYNEFKKWLPDKMHLHVAPTYIRLTPDAVAHDITLEDLTSRNQNAIKALEKSLTERIRNGELKTSDLYNQTIVKDLLFGKKGDDQND